MSVYTHIVHSMATVVGQQKFKKIGTGVNAACPGNLSACHCGHACHRFAALFLAVACLADTQIRP